MGSRGSPMGGWEGTPDPCTRASYHEVRWRVPFTVAATCCRAATAATGLVDSTLSLPSQRGRSFEMSLRNCATRVWITTQSTNRLRKFTRKRPTSSLAKTSPLLALNVSFAWKWCSSQVSLFKVPAMSMTFLSRAS